MTPGTSLARRVDPEKIRREIHEINSELREMKSKAEHKIVRLANLVGAVQKHKLFKEWKDPATKKPYVTFSQWLAAEITESKSSVYRLLAVREHLKQIPDAKLEQYGNSRVFELVKVAKEKPDLLPKFVAAIEKNPELKLYGLQQMVTNALAGSHMDSGNYRRWEFAVRVEDEPYLVKAMAVMQALEAVHSPETATGRGIHLVSIVQDFLSGKEQSGILKNLEAAGAFSNGFAKVEE